MSKFWTVLLKIIMVMSFIGILVFVGIAIFNNINISYEAYNYIYTLHNKTDFNTLQNNIYNNVKTKYNGQYDDYARFINSSITQINMGIDFYLDYLANEDKLSKGEQDKLCSLYDSYIKSFSETQKDYNQYTFAYDEAKIKIETNHNDANYAIVNLRARGVELVKNYAKCYQNGSKFFKYLVSVVQNHCFDGKSYHVYTGLCYMIKVGLIDNSIVYVMSDMNIKLNDSGFNKSITSYDLVDSYYDFLQKESSFSQKVTITNNSLLAFINNLNSLDVYEWAGNFGKYTENLSDTLKQKSKSAKSFYDVNFRGIEEWENDF